ncbi:MAG UNVERIFIED_CONTAM: hypothetical protein LVT10_03480 [Anaerolineae bacterium]|jgi:hypothetical protein
MSTLIKRTIVWGLSLVLGFILTWAMVVFFFPIAIPQEAGKGLADYGLMLTILTAIPLSLIFVTWLDYLLDANILPK